VTLQLPRPPSADLHRTDARAYFSELTDFLNKLVQELERADRAAETPAKAAFALTNIAAPTTALDGAAGTLTDVKNFIGGLCATLLAKGLIRTKVGPD
jgi:hypothetical protein